ncbi:MAG: hypothetical protein IAG13_16170 [Deltaproteobacteria bacterium]|nr:hypothetical protein [Nannocystaceae bacterium]
MLGLIGKLAPYGAEGRALEINGALAIVAVLGNAVFSVVTLETDGDRICAINIVRNPDKLAPFANANGLVVLHEPGHA